jgi:SEC-C motif-containing protein
MRNISEIAYMIDKPCFCCSNKLFKNCCFPYLSGEIHASTAEKLMRSRYSAYASIHTDYLVKTAHFTIRKNDSPKNIENWAKSNQWQKLEIIQTSNGLENDTVGMVEFKAYFINPKGKGEIHHERSFFVKENDEWFYKSGIFNPKN